MFHTFFLALTGKSSGNTRKKPRKFEINGYLCILAILIARRIRILGSQQNDREYLYEALQIAASGKVKVMTETYSLDEIGKAYERVADGKVRFRAVITT